MQRSRIAALNLILVLGFVLVGLRLLDLQGVDWRAYRVQAENTRRQVRYLQAPRGAIYDVAGRPLAVETPSHDVVFTLGELERARGVLRQVGRALAAGMRRGESPWSEDHLAFLLQELRNEIRPILLADEALQPHAWLRNVSPEAAERLAARIAARPQDLPGVRVETAGNVGSISIVPAEMFAGERAVGLLAHRLGLGSDSQFFSERVWLPYLRVRAIGNRTARQWALEEERVLFRDVPFEVVRELVYWPARWPGLRVRAGSRRAYPAGRTLAQLIGYLGRPSEQQLRRWREEERLLHERGGIKDIRTFLALRPVAHFEDARIGKSGLERTFEERLRGQAGARILEVDRRGRERGEALEEARVEPGADLRLTLDLELCQELERALADAGHAVGSALVADPATGDVLGWCSLPSFDSERFSDWQEVIHDARAPLLDRPLQAVLPPGSTFKMVAAIGALQEARVRPDETILCTGFYDPLRRDHLRCRNHPMLIENIDMRVALARSCNTYFYDLGGRRLKPEGLMRWAQAFGFGAPTGIEIPGPVGSVSIRHAESAAIGKGEVITTPLQVLRYTCAIANRGLLPDLRLVQKASVPRFLRLPVDPWVWDTVIAGMQDVVAFGTASDPMLGLNAFDCAVKTGTAEIGPTNIAWIVGFAPVRHPRIAFVVCMEDTALHGGEAAGPVATRILDWLTRHRQFELLIERGAR